MQGTNWIFPHLPHILEYVGKINSHMPKGSMQCAVKVFFSLIMKLQKLK